MIFRWLFDRREISWVERRANPHPDSRDAKCARCGVARQAHAREFHDFVRPKEKPRA